MNFTDISKTDFSFNNFTTFSDYNESINFYLGSYAPGDEKYIDLNDNEYIRL